MMPPDADIIARLHALQRGDMLAELWLPKTSVPPSRCVVFYLRVSSTMQLHTAGGQGLDDQWKSCSAYARNNELTIIGLYVDPAVSGRKAHRPAIDALKRAARTGLFKRVLFYRVNRMGRNVPAMWATADEVEACGVEVQSATENFSRSTAAGRLSFNMLAAMAQFGSDQQSEVIRDRLRHKVEDGGWVGPLPYGYTRSLPGGPLIFDHRVAPTAPLISAPAPNGSQLVPGSTAMAIIELFRQYNTCCFSDERLADAMNRAGWRTLNWQTGAWGLFGRESVRCILTNPVYIGMVKKKGVPIPGSHQPLIAMDVWESVQLLRSKRWHRRGAEHQPTEGMIDILEQRVWCYWCGAPMYRNYSGRITSRTARYRCSGPRSAGTRHTTCTMGLVRTESIEVEMRQLIAAMQITPQLQAIIVEEAQHADRGGRAKPKHSGVSPEALDARKKRLAQIYLDGLIAEAEYQRQLTHLQHQIAEASLAPNEPQQPALEDVLTLLTDLPHLVAAATRDELRALIAPVIERVWVTPHQVQGLTPTPAFQNVLSVIWRENAWPQMQAALNTHHPRTEVERGCPTGFEPATS